jgi:hypothetical protein
MNRKGSIEWNLETLGKTIFYVLILIGVFYLIYQLLALFVHGSEDYSAQRNVEIVAERIDDMIKNKEDTASVILALKQNYFIIGFDANQETVEFGDYKSHWVSNSDNKVAPIDRPSSCGFISKNKACLCTGKADMQNINGVATYITTLSSCAKVDVKTFSGTIQEGVDDRSSIPNYYFSLKKRSPSPFSTDSWALFLSGHERPRNLYLKYYNGNILLYDGT